ncbi:hypothetical protein C8A03DRAFT_39386 [Achaetomium macrosporum]|uniref:Zn(2)-C6 fungal-type domain-containing protein n=1 Tax=Achaetomium macrosporum TaxID=79813 RepID=A0AAN7C0G6_9PEZI|nr:hypothetical protein C8A03DRAFT_39386 [Achaetomium macrosporum]
MDQSGQPPIALSKPSRILIACGRCKAHKHRCDGGKPKCGNCAVRGAECDYAAVRRTRGPGKKNKKGAGTVAAANPPSGLPEPPRMPWSLPGGQPTEPTTASNSPPKTRTNAPSNWIPISADSLLSSVYEHRTTVARQIDEVIAGRRKYTPLLPRHIASRLIQNSFDAIMADYPLLDLHSFVTLVDEQYAACSTESDPADNPARWALVNAVFALALRFKIAPAAQDELAMYPRAFYRNAAAVLPELVLQDSSLLSIQALLAMAMFAQATFSDNSPSSVVMLVSNASRQVELLLQRARQGPLVLDATEEAQFRRVYGIASALEARAAQRYRVRPLLQAGGG